MALAKVDFFSQSLQRVTSFYALLPNDSPDYIKNGNKRYNEDVKALYLLHGFSGGSTDWLINSAVAEMSGKYNMAIIMPSGENSFYLDAKGTGNAFGQFTGQELVDYTRNMFGLSSKREDTFIGGLSMGGFGALRTGLKYNNTFGKVVALSSALIVNGIKNIEEGFDNGIANYDYYKSTFGELKKLGESENNPEYLVKKLLENKKVIPEIYMSCGLEDFLIKENREFKTFLNECGINVEYSEDEGVHDWRYWNSHLEPAIKWILNL